MVAGITAKSNRASFRFEISACYELTFHWESSPPYADHSEEILTEFFRLTCDRDLEGIVAKKKWGSYGEAWFKIRNPKCSQYEGRHDLFKKVAVTSG